VILAQSVKRVLTKGDTMSREIVFTMAEFMVMTPKQALEIKKEHESLLRISLKYIKGDERQEKYLNKLREACGYPTK